MLREGKLDYKIFKALCVELPYYVIAECSYFVGDATANNLMQKGPRKNEVELTREQFETFMHIVTRGNKKNQVFKIGEKHILFV